MHDNGFCFADEVSIQKKLAENVEISIYELALSSKSLTVLLREGIHTLSQLTSLKLSNLVRIRRLGEKSLEEIIVAVHEYGCFFADEQLVAKKYLETPVEGVEVSEELKERKKFLLEQYDHLVIEKIRLWKRSHEINQSLDSLFETVLSKEATKQKKLHV